MPRRLLQICSWPHHLVTVDDLPQVTAVRTAKEAVHALENGTFDIALKNHDPATGVNACRFLRKATGLPVVGEPSSHFPSATFIVSIGRFTSGCWHIRLVSGQPLRAPVSLRSPRCPYAHFAAEASKVMTSYNALPPQSCRTRTSGRRSSSA